MKNIIGIILFTLTLVSCNTNKPDKDVCLSQIKFLNNDFDRVNEKILLEIEELDSNYMPKNNSQAFSDILNYLDSFEKSIYLDVDGLTEQESYEKLKLVLFNNEPLGKNTYKYSPYSLRLKIEEFNKKISGKLIVNIKDKHQKRGFALWEVAEFYGYSGEFVKMKIKILRHQILDLKKIYSKELCIAKKAS